MYAMMEGNPVDKEHLMIFPMEEDGLMPSKLEAPVATASSGKSRTRRLESKEKFGRPNRRRDTPIPYALLPQYVQMQQQYNIFVPSNWDAQLRGCWEERNVNKLAASLEASHLSSLPQSNFECRSYEASRNPSPIDGEDQVDPKSL